MLEVLKQMQEALREYHYYTIDAGLPNQSMLNKGYAAYQAGHQAIAELESQEPFGYVNRDEVVEHMGLVSCGTIYRHPAEGRLALYTRPPQRTWVGLTDDDVMEVWEKIKDGDWAMDFYDVIEAKLKEKNCD
jgi:hypothetical protein